MSDRGQEREALQPTAAEVEAAARAYWLAIDGMTPGAMPWDSLPEAGRIEQVEHSRMALQAALAARGEPPRPGYWPGTADREEVGPVGDGTPHARMGWFWERMRPHEKLIGELTGWNPVSSTYRFEAAIADAFDRLAARENRVADREHDGQRGIRVEAVAAGQLKAGDMVLAGDRPHILVDDANAHHQGANPPTIWFADFRDPSIVDLWGQIWRVVRAQQPGEAITRDERHLRLVAARKPREVYAYTTEIAKRLLDQEGKHLVIDADQAGHLEFRLLDLEADLGVRDTKQEPSS